MKKKRTKTPEDFIKEYYVIYKITNVFTGRIYIGQHGTNDVRDGYFGSGKDLNRDVKLLGRSAFTKEILYIYDNFEDMDYMEKVLVTLAEVDDPNYYNLTTGGLGLDPYTAYLRKKHWWDTSPDAEALRKKQSERCKNDPNFRPKTSNKGRVQKLTEEERKRRVDFMREWNAIPENKELVSRSNKNKVVSKTTREKIGNAHRGKYVSEETRKRIGDGHRGKTLSLEARKKVSDFHKGQVRPKHECPHCGTIGGTPGIKTYHFDNCKQKPRTEALG